MQIVSMSSCQKSRLYIEDLEPRIKPYRWMKIIPEAEKGNRVMKNRLGKS
jgi:hypothetical protein